MGTAIEIIAFTLIFPKSFREQSIEAIHGKRCSIQHGAINDLPFSGAACFIHRTH